VLPIVSALFAAGLAGTTDAGEKPLVAGLGTPVIDSATGLVNVPTLCTPML